MKGLNKKKIINSFGFTLIELLAVIIILGVLLLISVPAISKYIEKSKKEIYINTINGIVNSISNKVNSLNYMLPNSQEAVIIPFSEAELDKGTNDKSPFATYVDGKNYVIVTFNGKKYNYFVVALDEAGYAIPLVNTNDLNNKSITKDETKIDNNIFSVDEIVDSSVWGEINTDTFSMKYISNKDNIIKVKIGEISYKKGDIVQLKDGSKWYATEDSDAASKTINLLSYNHMELTEENYGIQSSSKYNPKTRFNEVDNIISDGNLVWNNNVKMFNISNKIISNLTVNLINSGIDINEAIIKFPEITDLCKSDNVLTTCQTELTYLKDNGGFWTKSVNENGKSIITIDENGVTTTSFSIDSDELGVRIIVKNLLKSNIDNSTSNDINKVEEIENINDYIIPQDFGAKGDGVTDDTAAMKAFFEQAKAVNGNKKLYIPDGNYNIKISSNDTLASYQKESNIKIISEDNAIIKNSATDMRVGNIIILEDCNYVYMKINYEGKNEFAYRKDEPGINSSGEDLIFVTNSSNNKSSNMKFELNTKYVVAAVRIGNYRTKHNNTENITVNGTSYASRYFVAAYGVDGLIVDCECIKIHRSVYLGGCKNVNITNKYFDHYDTDTNILVVNEWLNGEMIGCENAVIKCYDMKYDRANGTNSVGISPQSYRMGATSQNDVIDKDTDILFKDIKVYVAKKADYSNIMGILNSVYVEDTPGFTITTKYEGIELEFDDFRKYNSSENRIFRDYYTNTNPVLNGNKGTPIITIKNSVSKHPMVVNESMHLKLINCDSVYIINTTKTSDMEPGKFELVNSTINGNSKRITIEADSTSVIYDDIDFADRKTYYVGMQKIIAFSSPFNYKRDYYTGYFQVSSIEKPKEIIVLSPNKLVGRTLELYVNEDTEPYQSYIIIEDKPIKFEITDWNKITKIRFKIKETSDLPAENIRPNFVLKY